MKLFKAIGTLILASAMFCFCQPVYSFSFPQNIESHFFWTKSYKKAHPKPTNNMPKSMAEYHRRAKETAESDKDIPNPKFAEDEKVVETPGPDIVFEKYNNPAGKKEINLNELVKTHKVNSIGVVSPLKDKMVYSTVYFYPETRTAATELYMLSLDTSKTLYNRVQGAHVNHGRKTLYRTGMDALDLDLYRTLTVIDWSSDGKKVAFKEKIAYTADGLWKTNLYVYNVETGSIKQLTEVREAIQYYWRKHQGLMLADYRWDIFPIGWDALNPNRIIVFAYAFTDASPKYLGAWSIDYEGNSSLLMSLTKTSFDVSQNGICLKAVYSN